MALGFFDGVHKGHQKVIMAAVKKAKEKGVAVTVMSFFPHPKTVLSNGKKTVDYIIPLAEKEKVLEQLGVDTFYIVEFDRAFASLSPEEYISNYLVDLGVVHAVAGYDFSYGKFGAGHVDRIEKDSNYRIGVTKVSKVEYQGTKISSTWIRQLLLSGNIEDLPKLLGRPYEIQCEWDGHNFKTLPQYIVPAPGCYKVTIKDGNLAKIAYVEAREDRDTVHLLDFNERNVYSIDQVSIGMASLCKNWCHLFLFKFKLRFKRRTFMDIQQAASALLDAEAKKTAIEPFTSSTEIFL